MLFNKKSTQLLRFSLLVLGCSVPSASAEEAAEAHAVASTEPCIDKHSSKGDCKEWAWFGECDLNAAFMHDQCRHSCGLCTPSEDEREPCQDFHASCTDWAEKGNKKVDNMCTGHWNSFKGNNLITGAFIVELCPVACKTCDIHLDDRDIDLGIGVPQSYDGMDTDKELFNFLKSKVAEIQSYVESIEDPEIREVCKMSNPHCARYALSSDCDTHFDHPSIKYGCAAACQTCENLAKDNGIFEARHMWGAALREFNEKKLAKKTITASA